MPDMERMFKKFDANGDGKISKSELTEALQTLGSTFPDNVRQIMAELDINGAVSSTSTSSLPSSETIAN